MGLRVQLLLHLHLNHSEFLLSRKKSGPDNVIYFVVGWMVHCPICIELKCSKGWWGAKKRVPIRPSVQGNRVCYNVQWC